MNVANGYNWSAAFPKYEEIFSSGIVERGVEYLVNSRIPGEGWGILPGLPTELHPTSLAVSALFGSRSRTAMGTAAGAATFVREQYGKTVDALSLEGVCDLLFVSAAEQRPMDDDYRQRLAAAAVACYDILDASESQTSTRLLCTFLIAVEQARLAVPVDTSDLIGRLCLSQRPDGGWPPLPQQPSSMVASAFAVRALMCRTDRRALDAAARGSSFLLGQLASLGWAQIASTGGMFAVALILWALASSDVEYRAVRDGIDLLQSTITSDGGWGDGPNEKASIETTAICLLALTAAGENRFIPVRLAATAVALLDRKVISLTNELDMIKGAMRKSVQDECGGVVRERDRLLKKNEDLSKQLTAATRQVREKIEDDERIRAERYRWEREVQLLQGTTFRRKTRVSWVRYAIAEGPWLILFMAAVSGISLIWQWPLTLVRGLGIMGILLVAATLGWRLSRGRITMDSPLVEPGDLRGDLEMLRAMYADMSASWPPSIREELTYRLFTEFVEMPPDIGTRYAEELAMRIGLPSAARAAFAHWARLATRIPPSERRLLFSQLERIILR